MQITSDHWSGRKLRSATCREGRDGAIRILPLFHEIPHEFPAVDFLTKCWDVVNFRYIADLKDGA